ncbi:uncharacterized protein LOC143191687 isoform X1 [Rhynchophorus ferrugineus]|uniref:uncharacterized protein LOC143191687 isoform X1 n=1 Tax=Rhynchophorus ferrugineus TaxID=354439 RepID=UPI003FCCF42C
MTSIDPSWDKSEIIHSTVQLLKDRRSRSNFLQLNMRQTNATVLFFTIVLLCLFVMQVGASFLTYFDFLSTNKLMDGQVIRVINCAKGYLYKRNRCIKIFGYRS